MDENKRQLMQKLFFSLFFATGIIFIAMLWHLNKLQQAGTPQLYTPAHAEDKTLEEPEECESMPGGCKG